MIAIREEDLRLTSQQWTLVQFLVSFQNMDSVTINIELCQIRNGKYHFISSVDCRSGIDSGHESWAALSFTSVRGQIVRDTQIIVPGPVHNCKGMARRGLDKILNLNLS